MSTRNQSRRTISLSVEPNKRLLLQSKKLEISKAIQNRDAPSLLNRTFNRSSVSPSLPKPSESSDSTLQLLLLKKTINRQRVSVDYGDKTLTGLKYELKQLDLESTKRDFWNRQNAFKVKGLESSLEEILKKQIEEIQNRNIYYHLLKRLKKTKIFMELRSHWLHDNLTNREHLLETEGKKRMHFQEAASQAHFAYKTLAQTVTKETDEGLAQITHLQRSINVSRIIAERREEWKLHQESMFEEAVIEDFCTKNQTMKENLGLCRLWYEVLNRIFQEKQKKFKRFEEAFMKIKIITGIPDVEMVVENFLTKEQTYFGLLESVKRKEVSCNQYKEKIGLLQKNVALLANKEIEKASIDGIKNYEQRVMKEIFDISLKKLDIQNTHAKLRNWMILMIKKFNKILMRPSGELPNDEKLAFYVKEIKLICAQGIQGNVVREKLGKAIEENRKLAVLSAISQLSKVNHSLIAEEKTSNSELIGITESAIKGR